MMKEATLRTYFFLALLIVFAWSKPVTALNFKTPENRDSPKKMRFIAAIVFEGNQEISSKDLHGFISLREGEVFDPLKHKDVLLQIKKAYEKHGFFQSTVSVHYENAPDFIRQRIRFSIVEGERARVRKIFLDVKNGNGQAIAERFPLQKGDVFTFHVLQKAVQTIRDYLARKQYFRSRVYHPEVQFNAAKSEVDISLSLHVGPRFAFYFFGNELFSRRTLLDALVEYQKGLLGAIGVPGLSQALLTFYKGRGYANVEISTDVKESKDLLEVTFHIEEGYRALLQKITILGNRVVEEKTYEEFIRAHTPLLKSGYFSQSDIENALPPLMLHLNSFGLLSPTIVDVKFIKEREGKFYRVEIVVDEGVQTRIHSITFSGNQIFSREKLHGLVVKSGDPLNIREIELAINRIEAWYQEQGYMQVVVSRPKLPLSEESRVIRIQKDLKLANISISIEEGPQVRIGKIIIQGNDRTEESVIRRELTIKEGDLLNMFELRQNEAKLLRLGLFSQVLISPTKPEVKLPTQDLLIHVKELDHGAVEFGFGYSIEDGIRGFTGIAHRNLWGRNRTGNAFLRLNRLFNRKEVPTSNEIFVEALASGGYVEPRLFGTLLTWRNVLQYEKDATIPFDIESYRGVTSFEFPISPFNVIGKYQLEWRNIFRANEVGEETKRLIGAVLPTLQLDLRDDLFYPKNGSFHSTTLEYASPALASSKEIYYLKWIGDTNWYFKLLDPVVAAFSFRGGYGKSLGSEAIPIDKRFYLGGRGSIRGFKERTLGTITEVDTVTLETFLNYKSELRFPIYGPILASLFQDGGGVFVFADPTWEGSVRNTAGISFQYKTPVGPVGIDFAFLLDKRPEEKILRVDFSIGSF